MIAVRLSIASVDSPLWVDVVRRRFDRFEKVSVSDTESILLMPRVGAILLIDTGRALTIHAVAGDDGTLGFIREAIAYEVSIAVPETTQGHRLELEWDYPQHNPVRFR